MMARDYGIRARMNGEMDAAVEQLRALGGWSVTSKVPLKYAKRFVEMVSNQSNQRRTKQADQYLAISEEKTSTPETVQSYNVLEGNGYDNDSVFDELFG